MNHKTNIFILILITISASILNACSNAPSSPYSYLKSQNISAPEQNSFKHCYNYGCERIVNVGFSDSDWKNIDALFTPSPKTPEQEREQISQAIGIFEQIVGEKTGTKADKFGTFRHMGRFQHDCIDESTNTTIYLTILDARGLLKFHTPSSPDSRVPILNGGHWPHRTAIIYDKQSQQSYAVDSWFHDNGFPAEVILLSLWKKGWKPEENLSLPSD